MSQAPTTRPSSPDPTPIAIIGIGCRFPGGARTPAEFWRQLCEGKDGVVEVPPDRWNLKRYFHPEPGKPGKSYSKWAGLIDGLDQFDPQFFGLSAREAAFIDPQQRLLLEVAWEALEDGGQPVDLAHGTDTGVFVGISTSDYEIIQTSGNSFSAIDPFSTTGSTMSLAANRVSYCLNLCGPSVPIDTACSSSLVAVHLACAALRDGECATAIAAGANAIIGPIPFIAFSSMGMLSPDGRCKAFDAAANGFVRGEGAGAVLLKPLSAALAAGDRIHAVILATGSNQDGRTPGITVPSEEAQAALVERACRDAGIAPADVQYVEAHGTGTMVGDPIEARALGRALSRGRRRGHECALGSVKTNIGHLEAGAGIAGVIKAALVVEHQLIPPNLHFKEPNPQIDFRALKLRVPVELTEFRNGPGRRIAGVNSFGWGGANAHALLEAPPSQKTSRRRDGVRSWLLPLSARTPEALTAVAGEYAAFLRKPGTPPLRDIAYTAAVRRTHFEHRIAFAGRTKRELARKLDEFARGESRQTATQVTSGTAFSAEGASSYQPGATPQEPAARRASAESATHSMNRAFSAERSSGPKPGALPQASYEGAPSALNRHSSRKKIAFVFSGQGPQWWRMGRDLLAREPVFREKIEECDALLRELAGWSLLDELHAGEAASRLDHTGVAQPAIFALQVALAALWRSWGIEPAAVIGHSVGEVAAAHVAGIFDLRTAMRIIFHRGDSMEHATGEGRMLAAGLSAEEAEKIVAGDPGRLFLAAVNSPSSVTLSGEAAALAPVAEQLEARGVFARFVPVQYAFHSAQMDPVEPMLRAALASLAPRPSQIPMASTVTGRLAAGPELDAAYWWRNVRDPVRFATGLDLLIQDGCRTFLELSPHPVLAASVHECLAAHGERGAVLASLVRETDDQTAMLTALGALHSLGHPVRWDAVLPGGSRFVEVPRYPWQRARHWNEPPASRALRLDTVPHPFLEKRVACAEPCWEVQLDRRTFPWLSDHRVHGRAVFPAAGFLEMAFAAARELLGPGSWVLEDIDFLQALFLPETDEAPLLQITVAPQDFSFAIRSRAHAGSPTWTTHATGKMRLDARAAPVPPFPLEAARARCTTPVESARLYELLFEGGLQYGPCFQGMDQIWRRELEAVAQVALPARLAGEGSDYLIHPAYLDSCFQPGLAALPTRDFGRESGVWLPIHLDRIQFFSAPPSRAWTHGEILQLGRRASSGDMRLLDAAGNIYLQFTGLRLLFLDAADRDVAEWFYELQWHLKPLAVSAPPGGLTFFPSAAPLARRWQREMDLARAASRLAQRWRKLEPQIDALCAGYIRHALDELGAVAGVIDPGGKALGIAPKYERLLGAWLRHLQHDGIARETASGWSVRRTPRPPDLGKLWRAILEQMPSFAPELTLLDRCGRQLAGVLRGEVDPLSLLFPDGSTSALDQFYADSDIFRPPNIVVQKAIDAVLARLPEGRKLRIVELGAGTGGTTARLLPRLPADRVEYVFTDVSNFFFAKCEQKFQGYSFVRYELLDIEKDPAAQGFELHRADIVIAADVLHATADLRTALVHVEQLLAPDGLFLLVEFDRTPRWADLVFGLTDGWWRFRDGRTSPSVPRKRWEELLAEAGFRDTTGVTCGIQSVLFARGAPQEETTAPVEPTTEPGRWLIFADRGGVAEELAALLRARGHACELVSRDDAPPASSEFTGVLHLWSLDDAETDDLSADALDAAQNFGSLSVLRLAQALASTEQPPPLWLITRGAQPAGERPAPLGMAQTPLVGLGRLIRVEHPQIRCRLIDLDPTPSPRDAPALLAELLGGDEEEDIAWRGEARYVQRLARGSLLPAPRGPRRFVDPQRHPCRLEIARPGMLDRLVLRRAARRRPGPAEIEIEVAAAGLNFRDVMKALGIYPSEADDAAILGDECAGRITAVGKGVRGLRVGDEVMAIAPGCLASHAITPAAFAFPRPPHLTCEEAATMLIAYLTASYALLHLGRMRRGERVLIHAAAGGVGFAAVQLARRVGAEIFATAGSAEKRDFLRACGVAHVMDSRSLAFADEIMEITGGRGVDLVLNSLAGEAIPRSLSVLGAHGRFLEIGKRDIYENSRLGLRPFRNNLAFFAVDLSRAMQPDFIREFAGTLRRQFASGHLCPLPHRTFPLGDSVSAFRYMAQAKQVGKVVITMRGETVAPEPPATNPRAEFRRNGTYLLTGGFGGFGLLVAQWMAVKGARHLVIMSRSGPTTDEAREAVKVMERMGARVVIARGDVSREEDVRKVLKQIARTLPPLHGVLHAAMVLDDAMLLQLDEERFRRVMAPKVRGGWHLHKLTYGLPLDFFVLFSSAASVIGNPGQANYVAANCFLDALAHHRHALGLPALAVNWGLLTEAGYVARTPKLQEYFARLGWTGMSARKAVHMLARLLPTPVAQMVVTRIDWSAMPARIANLPRYSLLMSEVASGGETRNDAAWIREAVMNVPPAEGRRIVENYLREQIAKVLRLPPAKLSVDRPLTELGLDSLMAVELINRIESQLGAAVPTGKLVGGPTIARISVAVLEALTGATVETVPETAPAEGLAFAADVRLDPALRFDAPLVAPRPFTSVLLTGATGFLGAFLLRELLEKTDAQVICPVAAAASEDEARRLLAETQEKYGLAADLSRVVPLAGDWPSLVAEVDAIFHAEAEAHHAAPYEKLKAANVDSIHTILRLATTARRTPVHYLSSVSVLPAAGEAPLREDDALPHAQHLSSGYAQTRWVAEKILELARIRGLPVSIYRPGWIVGDSRTGVCSGEDASWRLLKACVDAGCGAGGDINTFLTPVDYIAAATVALALQPGAANRTHHLINPHRSTFTDILQAARRFGYPLEILAQEQWEARMKTVGDERHLASIRAYAPLIPAAFPETFRRLSALAEVDCTRTLTALAPGGVSCPPIDEALLARCFEYLIRTGFLPRPPAKPRKRSSHSHSHSKKE